ncbi:MAG TPA: hypothetical protein VME69_15890 [Methylocella sp.]|nr:hypothetical protein [Methylocella sp.]
MSLENERASGGGPEALGNRSLLGSENSPESNQVAPETQSEFAAITCAELRIEKLRERTEIDCDLLQVKLLVAKHFNREGLDEDASEALREAWRLFQTSLSPARQELRFALEALR